MKTRPCALSLCAVVLATGITSVASAGLPYGTAVPITVPTDNVTVTLVFDHTAADFTGNLYFLGSGDASTVLSPAPNSDGTNQGFFAFNNHTSALGSTVLLPGAFNAGDVLHFAYDIIAPGDATTDVLRSDVAGDQAQFAWDTENSFFAIEDVYPDDGSDLDYNDIVIGVIFNPVPGPGALALLGLAGLMGRGRRRA